MKAYHAVIIGAFVLVGIFAHGLLTMPRGTATEDESIRMVVDFHDDAVITELGRVQMQRELVKVQPASVRVGEETLLYSPHATYRNGWFDSDWKFYRYDAATNKLIAVPMEGE